MIVEKHHDSLLCEKLNSLSKTDKDYWSFRNTARREHGHNLFQYPAMMVPQVVSSILNQVNSVHTDINQIGDPFVGSGTILIESMMRGYSFNGADINPLAILLCKVKSGPFHIQILKEKIDELCFEKSRTIKKVLLK